MSCLVEPSSSSASPLHQTPSISSDPQIAILNICRSLQDKYLQPNDSPQPVLLTSFDAVSIPSISLHDFLQRILKFSYCSLEALIVALVFIDRIAERRPDFIVNNRKIHRLLFVAIIVSIKFLDDKYYNNEYYAKVGGVTVKELNRMEKEFLFLIGFRLFVEEELFCKYFERVRRSKEDQGRKHHSRKE